MPSAEPIDRALWRVAEAGSRHSATDLGDQRRAWAEIEAAVAEARRLYDQTAETAAAVVKAELGRAESTGVAEAARVAAAKAVREASAVRRRAEARLEEFEAAESALQAQIAGAMTAAAEASAERARAESERDQARAALLHTEETHRATLIALARVESQRDAALAALSHTEAALSDIAAERDRAVTALTSVAPPPVAVGAVAEADAGDLADRGSGDRDFGHGTFGSRPDFSDGIAAFEVVLGTGVFADANGDVAGFTVEARSPTVPPGPFRQLEVGATFANLLPADLADLLVSGVSVIRQDGRLAAVLAVPCDQRGAPTSEAEEQAEQLRTNGYRVAWTDEIYLAS